MEIKGALRRPFCFCGKVSGDDSASDLFVVKHGVLVQKRFLDM